MRGSNEWLPSFTLLAEILAQQVRILEGQNLETLELHRIESALRTLISTRRATMVRFSVPRFRRLTGGPYLMPQAITLDDDREAVVPLLFSDALGAVHAPATGGSVSVDNAAVATAALSDTDDSVTVVPVADGVAVVTYTNGALSDTLTVTVQAPTPTQVAFDVAHATFPPKP